MNEMFPVLLSEEQIEDLMALVQPKAENDPWYDGLYIKLFKALP